MKNLLKKFIAPVAAVCIALRVLGVNVNAAEAWQKHAAGLDPKKDDFVGLDFLVRADPQESWPRLLRELQIDAGRHLCSHNSAGPHSSRRFAPIDFGIIMPAGAEEPEFEDCRRCWSHSVLTLTYKRGAEEKMLYPEAGEDGTLRVVASRLTPAVLIKLDSYKLVLMAGEKYIGTRFPGTPDGQMENVQSRRECKGVSTPALYAARTGSGISIKHRAELAELPLADMERGWLLAWFGKESFFVGMTQANVNMTTFGSQDVWHKAAYQGDCPMLMLFNGPVAGLTASEHGDGITVEFAGDDGGAVILPLFGEVMPRAEDTEKWAQGLPEEVITRCDWWAAQCAKIPIDAEESYSADPANDVTTIKERFLFEEFREFGRPAAPVPPMLATAFLEGFPMKFSAEPANPKLLTSVGSWLAVPGVEEYSMTFSGLGKYIAGRNAAAGASAAPEHLRQALEREVALILEAGHLAPWYRPQKHAPGWWGGAFTPTEHLIHQIPGEILYFLAEAMPYVAEPVREKIPAYMKREREEYPPEARDLLWADEGARRESYGIPDEFLARDNSKDAGNLNYGRSRNFYVRNKLIPLSAAYHLARYYEAAGNGELAECGADIRQIREPYLERMDWATGSSFRWPDTYLLSSYGWGIHRDQTDVWLGFGGVVDANNAFAGALGFARMAGMLADAEEQNRAWGLFARAAAARFAMGKMAGHLYRLGAMTVARDQESPDDDVRMPFIVDEYGMSLYFRNSMDYYSGLLPLRDAVPELGMFARDFLKREMELHYSAFEENIPEWHQAWTLSTIENETNCPWPQDAYQTFMAHAWIFDSPPEWLEKHLDVPWQARGDLYYLHKLVETIRAYGVAK